MSRYTYTTKSGLKCIFIKREGFVEGYAGIGFHFGGAHLEYKKNGEYRKLKSGIAHFLEHKAFTMKDGRDGLEVLEGMNALANAYTSFEQTIYYLQTSDSIINPIKTLIKMLFEIGFNEEQIEHEKSIILSEKRDSLDIVDRRINDTWKSMLYPNDSYSLDILGNEEDIMSMTYDDLKEAFDAFYRPDNALMVIVGDYDEKEIFNAIEDSISSFSFDDSCIERLPFIKSKELEKPRYILEEVPYPELHVIGRIDSLNYHNPMITNIFIALLDNLFSVKAPFYKELSKRGLLILDDIEYTISAHEFGLYYDLNIYTDDPEALYELIYNKLKAFSEEDYYEEISTKTMKLYLCDYIRALDSISYIGDETINLGLEGTDYEEEYNRIKNISSDDIKKYIPYIRDSLISALAVYPKEK